MADFADDTLLARWLAGELSAEEERALRARPDFAEYERLAEASRKLSVPSYNTEDELQRIKSRLHQSERPGPSPLPSTRPQVRARPYLRYASIAAAVLLLVVAGLYLLPRGGVVGEQRSLTTQAGRTELLQLGDGTEIRLNAASTLAYDLGNRSRRIELTGEAYFDVAHDPDRPFRVQTPGGTVTVLGTSFNVHSRAGQLRVACTSGRVAVVIGGREHILTEGQAVDSEAGETVAESPEDLDWLEGRSVFRGRPLDEIIAELERQFDLQVVDEAGLDRTQRLTTTFTHDDRAVALRAVFGALPEVSYRTEGRRVILFRD